MKERPTYTPLTDLDRAAIACLGDVTFLPGSFDKRFAQHWSEMIDPLAPVNALKITEKQRIVLWRLVHRYRRKIRDKATVRLAAEIIGVPKEPTVTKAGWLKGMKR